MSEPLPFTRIEPPVDCLSGLRISRAALDELTPDELAWVGPHLETCARCSGRIAAERSAIAAAANEPLPNLKRPEADVVSLAERRMALNASVLAKKDLSRSRRSSWLAGGAFLAAAALVFLVTRPADVVPPGGNDGVRAKGAPKIEVAVQRAGVDLGEPVAVADAPALRPDDKLRLRVGRSGGIHIALEGYDAGQWFELYRGVIPEDGWLPNGIVVTAGDPARLRVLVCKDEIPVAEVASAPMPLDTLKERPGCHFVEHTFEVR